MNRVTTTVLNTFPLKRNILRIFKLLLTPRLNLFFFGKSNRASLSEILHGVYLIGRQRYSIVEGSSESFVARYEKPFANLLGFDYAVSTGSGGMAIQLALRGLDLPAGSCVAVQHDTCVASAQAIIAANLNPIFVKTCLDTFTMDLLDLKKLIEEFQLSAVIGTHLAGGIENIAELKVITDKYGISLIEDSCLSLVPTDNSKRAYPLVTILSFGFSKPISVGEGGILLTDNHSLATKIQELRHWGTNPREGRLQDLKTPSWNGRASFLLLALAVSKIPNFLHSRKSLLRRISSVQRILEENNKPMAVYRGSAKSLQECGFDNVTFRFAETASSLDISNLKSKLLENGFELIEPTFPSIPRMTLFSESNWKKYFFPNDKHDFSINYLREYDSPSKLSRFLTIRTYQIHSRRGCHKFRNLIKSWEIE